MSARRPRSYDKVRAEVLERLVAQPALAGLRTGDDEDWLVALTGAWAALAEVIGFYQARIDEEAFLPTATQTASVERIYHSLGHRFPPNAAATTTLAYHLSATVAGVEAVGRARSAGGTGATAAERARLAEGTAPAGAGAGGAGGGGGAWPGPAGPGAGVAGGGAVTPGSPAGGPGGGGLPTATGLPTVGVPAGIETEGPGATTPASAVGLASTVPAAAQVRAIPGPTGSPPTFVTLAPLGAYVGASRLKADASTTAAPPAIGPATTMLELDGTRTGVAVGQPVLVAATAPAGGGRVSWVRLLSEVSADPERGATRVAWDAPLGSLDGEPGAKGVTDPVVLGFATASSPVGAGAPAWGSLSVAQQLAARTVAGSAMPVRGGFASSGDGGATWVLASDGLPPGADLVAVAGYEGGVTMVAAAGGGLLRAVSGGPFAPAALGGGPRRAVGFLGGTSSLMLAGAANGTVYTSVDQGRTWAPVPVRAPVIQESATPPASGTAHDATTDDHGTRMVTSFALPPATVRCVITDPAAAGAGARGNSAAGGGSGAGGDSSGDSGGGPVLLAGTDAGLFAYTGGGWSPVDGGPAAGTAVFDLLAVGSIVLAATAAGVWQRKDGSWTPMTSGAAQALAVWDGTWYAASGSGVGIVPQTASEPPAPAASAGTGLDGGEVTALAVGAKGLLAGTAGGVYAASGSGDGMTWARVDHATAFTFPTAVLPAAELAPPALPDPLVGAFADVGIALGAKAKLAADGTGAWTVDDGAGHTYRLTQGDTWTVQLLDALPGVADLAVAPGGDVLVAASAAAPVATDWPGFAIWGEEVEVAPPLKALPAGTVAVIEQRTATPATQVLAVTSVVQDSAVRAGRTVQLTRLGFDAPPLAPGRFPRAVSTVWTGSKPLPLFDPPATAVAPLQGKTLTLAEDLPAPLEPGRLATITGRPPGLTVAPLGGALRLPPPPLGTGTAPVAATPVTVGPPQADVVDLALTDDGTLHLATDEGVFALAPPNPPAAPDASGSSGASAGAGAVGVPLPIADGWPGGAATALALAGQIVVAGSAEGVQRLPATPTPEWRPAGLPGAVTALAAQGTAVVAALDDGTIHTTPDAAATPPAWTALPATTGGTASALAILPPQTDPGGAGAGAGTPAARHTRPRVVAATSAGVELLEPFARAWSVRDAGAVPGTVTDLAVDAAGTLWAGSPAGLHHLPDVDGAWLRDPGVTDPVTTIAVTPLAALVIAAGGAILRREGTGWTPAAAQTGALVSSIAAGADGALWLGARARLPLAVAPGSGQPEIRHEPLFAGVPGSVPSRAALDQGAVPSTVLAAFADAGHALDPSHAVVAADGEGCWTVRSKADVFVVAARGAADGATLNGYRVQAVLAPVGVPAAHGTVETWPVQAGGRPAQLTAPTSRIVQLPAAPDAPALAETARVATAQSTTLGAGSTLKLAGDLQHVYDLSTVQVNLNAVAAAHGQPTSVPVGSGDPDAAHQSFAVPTPVAAVAPASADPAAVAHASSLSVYVDGQRWSEVQSFHGAGPQDQVYVTESDADGRVRITFGDGRRGARLPAGSNNVVATYLQGGGEEGEVAQGALIQPLVRPQLVKAVHNPVAALVPPLPPAAEARTAAVRRLDRIVTAGDFEDVARAQAGVGSAVVDLVAGGLGRAIVVTVAATSDHPAEPLARVRRALPAVSASGLPVRVVAAVAVPVALTLRIVTADPKAPAAVRAALTGRGALRPGAPLHAARVLAAASAVPGVVAATIEGWQRVGAPTTTATSLPAHRARWPAGHPQPRAAELLVVDGHESRLAIAVTPPPEVPGT